MTDSGIFNDARRTLVCAACGSLVEAPLEGGSVTCSSCSHGWLVGPRPPPPASTTDRAERLFSPSPALHLDEGGELPAELAPFVETGSLPLRSKAKEIRRAWTEILADLRQQGSIEAEKRLIWLTRALYDPPLEHTALHQRARLQLRAEVESAAEVMGSSSHRQQMWSLLSRAACRAGDLVSAAAWLERSSGPADDAAGDAAVRLARGYIETARGNWAAVLNALGKTTREAPAATSYAAEVALLRANALEHLGRQNEAALLITRELRRLGTAHARLMARIVMANARTLPLCALSHTKGQRRYASEAVGKTPQWYNARLWILLPALLLTGFLVRELDAMHLPPAPEQLLGVSALAVGALFTIVLSWRAYRAYYQDVRLRAEGVPSIAMIDSAQPTGTLVNDLPQLDLRVRVLVGTGWSPARIKAYVHPLHMQRFSPGSRIPVRVDKKDPRHLVLELE